ncbi:hypothetical protein C8J56DRAFT_1157338 [Mycena floridula]|nr:hypothetical protein C8J56DRAFT_1157338 [Mycena floridula]
MTARLFPLHRQAPKSTNLLLRRPLYPTELHPYGSTAALDKSMVVETVIDEFSIPNELISNGVKPRIVPARFQVSPPNLSLLSLRSAPKKGLICQYPGAEKVAKVCKKLGVDEPQWIQLRL